MTGYQEILTDPSYAQQIVMLTYPHIGNTGTNSWDYESGNVWAQGLVVRDVPTHSSNRREERNLGDFLKAHGVVSIGQIDTRRLTKHIREQGAMGACIMSGAEVSENEAIAQAKAFPGLSGLDLAQVVSRVENQDWNEGSWYTDGTREGFREPDKSSYRVVAYDFGIKNNILRLLADRGCEITVVPAKTTSEAALSYEPDGIFLSNGPGDPEPCTYAIKAIQEFLSQGVPTFGICLGYQLLALASGAQTVKMSYGHHGANHPVLDLDSKQVIITSQNHGFAVDQDSLPDQLKATHISLFDRTLQGIHRTDVPAFGFQGHPEASPGPQDCRDFFDHFVELMRERKNSRG